MQQTIEPWESSAWESNKLRVLIVDSHVAVSELISMLLNREDRFAVVGETASGRQGLEYFHKYKPEIVISALELPEMNGVEMLREIRALNHTARIVIFSGTSNLDLLHDALEIEPQGFVHKTESLTLLRQAIGAVSQGVSYFSPHLTRLLNQKRLEGTTKGRLTPKERIILQLVAEGMSSKEVAHQLSLSPKTIEHYRKHLMQKLGLRSVASLTLYAVRRGLVQL